MLIGDFSTIENLLALSAEDSLSCRKREHAFLSKIGRFKFPYRYVFELIRFKDIPTSFSSFFLSFCCFFSFVSFLFSSFFSTDIPDIPTYRCRYVLGGHTDIPPQRLKYRCVWKSSHVRGRVTRYRVHVHRHRLSSLQMTSLLRFRRMSTDLGSKMFRDPIWTEPHRLHRKFLKISSSRNRKTNLACTPVL